MPSILADYEYDIFISYRQKDNHSDQWVTIFVQALKEELDATFKEDISIYFDENPHDGLHEHHEVDGSLKEKLKCLILIPVVSQTFCDPKAFAWEHEFKVFIEQAGNDQFGLKTKLSGGNVANRVLPIRIHDLDNEDVSLFESEIGGVMRSIDFIYQQTGVNRPLRANEENPSGNQNHTFYLDQVNKVANAIKDIISGLKAADSQTSEAQRPDESESSRPKKTRLTSEIKQRNVLRASLVYILAALVFWKVADIGIGLLNLPENTLQLISLALIVFFPIAMLMAWLYERSPQGFIKTGSTASRENPFTDVQKKPLTSNTFIVLLMATVAALFFIYPQAESGTALDNEEIDKSIAVIPFDDMSQGGDQQYFADGVMEDILTQLQKMGELRVTSKTSVEQYRNTTKSTPEIGRELNVNYILEGSVRKAGNQIMITAQLIRTGTDTHIWADNYTSEYTANELFEIQRQIAESIVSELKLKISPEKVADITQAQTDNSIAYEHYIKGRQFYSVRNKDANEKAIKELKLAIDIDVKYAAAYGMLSSAFTQRVSPYGFEASWIDSARVYAEMGLQYDVNCAECYKALGLVSGVKKGAAYYEKALALNPNYVTAHNNIITNYLRLGDFNSALKHIDKSYLYYQKNSDLARLYHFLGDYEKGAKYYENDLRGYWPYRYLARILQDEGNYKRYKEITDVAYRLSENTTAYNWDEVIYYSMRGDYQESINHFELKFDEQFNFSYLTADWIIHSYFKAGNIFKARNLCNKVLDGRGGGDVSDNIIRNITLAHIYSILGDEDKAIDYLEVAIDNNWLRRDIGKDIFLELLYEHPRFPDLVIKQQKKREEVMALVATWNFPEPEDLK